MSDRMAAEIWIGGKFRRSLLDEFPIQDLRVDWDYTPFDSSTEDGILKARDENGLLHFCENEAAWGEFADLEDCLREHNIPFVRQSSGKYEYLPERVYFRPDLEPGVDDACFTTDEGKPLVLKEALAPILASMQRLAKSKKPAGAKLKSWERLTARLAEAIPPDLPPLPPFDFVDG